MRGRTVQYECYGCGGIYTPVNISCAVAHPPGACCHYMEPVIQEPKWRTMNIPIDRVKEVQALLRDGESGA